MNNYSPPERLLEKDVLDLCKYVVNRIERIELLKIKVPKGKKDPAHERSQVLFIWVKDLYHFN